jgi:hypothetical protein
MGPPSNAILLRTGQHRRYLRQGSDTLANHHMRLLIGNAVEVKPEIRRSIALFRSAQVRGNVLLGPLHVVVDE